MRGRTQGLLLAAALAAGCAPALDHPVFGPISTGLIDFEHGGLQRQYALHVPEGVGRGAPLLLALHAYSDDAAAHREYTGLDALADRRGFVVAYPRGTLDGARLRFWNTGYPFHAGEGVDDVGFLAALASHLQDAYGADPERTWASGFSNGGDAGYSLACRRSDVFRGVVSVGGLMLDTLAADCPTGAPTPLFEIRGRDDDVTRFDGDPSGEGGWGRYPPVEDTVAFWRDRNGCTSTSEEVLRDDADGRAVTLTRHGDCAGAAEVWLAAIDGFGHDWPGGTEPFFWDASEALWGFLGER